MDDKELAIIKSLVRYSAGLGNFYRNKSDQPAVLSSKDYHALIRLTKGSFCNLYPAWKIAIYLSHDYWPAEGDTCEYKDGNKKNLRLSNLNVICISDDESTVMDYCLDNNLDYRYVSLKMRKEKRIRRNVAGMSYWFYKKEDLNRRCKNLKKVNLDNEIVKKHFKKRKNNHFMEFLSRHVLMPKRWEMTLC